MRMRLSLSSSASSTGTHLGTLRWKMSWSLVDWEGSTGVRGCRTASSSRSSSAAPTTPPTPPSRRDSVSRLPTLPAQSPTLVPAAHAPCGAVTFSTHYCAKFGKDYRLRDILVAGHRVRVQIFKVRLPPLSHVERHRLSVGWGWLEESACESRGVLAPIREEESGIPLWLDAHAVLFLHDRAADPAAAAANQRLAAIKGRTLYLPRFILANEPADVTASDAALHLVAEGQRVPLLNVGLKVQPFCLQGTGAGQDEKEVQEGGGVESAFVEAVKAGLEYWLLAREEAAEESGSTDSGIGTETQSSKLRPCFDCKVS